MPLPFQGGIVFYGHCIFSLSNFGHHTHCHFCNMVLVTQVSPLHCRMDDTREWILGDNNHWDSSMSPATPEWSSQRFNDLPKVTQLAIDWPGFEPRSHDMSVTAPLSTSLHGFPDEGRGTQWVEAPSAEGQEAWVGISDLAVIHHVTSGKSLLLSGPQFP